MIYSARPSSLKTIPFVATGTSWAPNWFPQVRV
jgi:hypothetical protein